LEEAAHAHAGGGAQGSSVDGGGGRSRGSRARTAPARLVQWAKIVALSGAGECVTAVGAWLAAWLSVPRRTVRRWVQREHLGPILGRGVLLDLDLNSEVALGELGAVAVGILLRLAGELLQPQCDRVLCQRRRRAAARGVRVLDLDRRKGDERAEPSAGGQGTHRAERRLGGHPPDGQMAGVQEAQARDGRHRAGLPRCQLARPGLRQRVQQRWPARSRPAPSGRPTLPPRSSASVRRCPTATPRSGAVSYGTIRRRCRKLDSAFAEPTSKVPLSY